MPKNSHVRNDTVVEVGGQLGFIRLGEARHKAGVALATATTTTTTATAHRRAASVATPTASRRATILESIAAGRPRRRGPRAAPTRRKRRSAAAAKGAAPAVAVAATTKAATPATVAGAKGAPTHAAAATTPDGGAATTAWRAVAGGKGARRRGGSGRLRRLLRSRRSGGRDRGGIGLVGAKVIVVVALRDVSPVGRLTRRRRHGAGADGGSEQLRVDEASGSVRMGGGRAWQGHAGVIDVERIRRVAVHTGRSKAGRARLRQVVAVRSCTRRDAARPSAAVVRSARSSLKVAGVDHASTGARREAQC